MKEIFMNLKKIGKFIAEMRKAKGLTQEELAEKLEVNNRTISRWENGKNMPDISLYKPLCEILKISIEELVNGEKTDKGNVNYSIEKAIINTMNSSEKDKSRMSKIIKILSIIFSVVVRMFYSDEDFDGAIIKLDKLNTFLIKNQFVFACAGLSLNEFVKKTLDNGYINFANLYGIPGLLGGAIIGNAGANGTEIFDDLKAVLVLKNNLVTLINKTNIKYEYRNTEFKNSNIIIIGAIFKLEKGDTKKAWEIIKENLEKRKNSQPLEYPSAGSVFKNPNGLSAGKLIDECNLKNISVGGAKVSNKHANFIINENNATSKDIKDLINKVKEEVKNQKNIDLELEQIIVKW